MKYIDQLELAGKRTFIRADLNVPFEEPGVIADDTRIRAALPTVQHALQHGARVALSSHLGRPKGKRVDSLSLAPVAVRLAELLGQEVSFVSDCIGDEAEEAISKLSDGEIALLENLRFHAEEEENDEAFSKNLARLCDAYVNDAFATAHRAHASTVGITSFVSEKAAGFTMRNELEYFEKAFRDPARPLVAIFGGAKISTKMNAIRHVGQNADKIIIGGAMANTFVVARGHEVGMSLYEKEQIENARSIIDLLETHHCELLLPVDYLVAPEFKTGVPVKAVGEREIRPDVMALDIGPESIRRFSEALDGAGTIVWNGPMGAFEIDEFSAGTYGIVDALCQSSALTVVGGGDTDLALHRKHAFDKMSYVSTAGGAFLKLLEGAVLPAVQALG